MLHIKSEKEKLSTTVGTSDNTVTSETQSSESVSAHAATSIEHVLISTAVVLAIISNGKSATRLWLTNKLYYGRVSPDITFKKE